MQVVFIDKEIAYDGSQLSSHFAHRELGILGDSCLAFVGPCEVTLDAMVDLEDVRRQDSIYSPKMLHFLLESFSLDLKGGVLLQRLLMAGIKEALGGKQISGISRKGDDLFVGERKLSVSIATKSPVSTLIHIGLNILTEGVPVPAIGLEELGLTGVDFGKACLKKIQEEYLEMLQATYKVRAVK